MKTHAPSNSKRAQSVVLLSGGLDSSANLAFAVQRDQPILALTVNYGQRAAQREFEAARRMCLHYDVRHETVEIPWLGALGGSALTVAGLGMPDVASVDLDRREVITESAKAVWVPNRNGILISIAAAYAERLGASQVVVGFNSEEAATFPDNSIAYLEQMSRALSYSTANGVRVQCYTAAWDKKRICLELDRLEQDAGVKSFPWDAVWSCYQGGEHPCGKCESCRRLTRARESRARV